MILSLLKQAQDFVLPVNLGIYALSVSLVGVFFFWRVFKRQVLDASELEAQGLEGQSPDFKSNGETNDPSQKEVRIFSVLENNKFFDVVIFSFVFGIVVARLIYILRVELNALNTEEICWFWIPYEKIDQQIYLLRCYPWRFFRVWDQKLNFEGFILGFLTFLYLSRYILKTSWERLFRSIVPMMVVLFGGFEFYRAVLTLNLMHFYVFGAIVMMAFLLLILNLKVIKFKYKAVVLMVLRIVLAIVGLIGFPVVLLIDRDFVDLTSVVDIVLLSSLVMGGWMFLAGIIPSLLKILALKKSKNPKEDEMASSDSSKEEKQALARRKRIKKRQQKQSGTSDLKPDNKQKTRAKETDWSKALDPKRFESGRSFSMSYKDFNKGWKKIWGNFMTLLSKIKKSNRGKREDLQSDESKTARSKTSQSKTTQPKTKGDSENNHE